MMYYGLSRTICEVLSEMRICLKTQNFSYLKSLIEECQVLANRMEAALHEKKDLKHLHKEKKDLKKEIKQLEQRLEALQDVCDSKKE